MMSSQTLFTAAKLGSLTLSNRLIVAPMTRISGTPTGEVGPLMSDYYTAFGKGGFGAIITEGVYTDTTFSQGYRNQPGIATSEQVESWKPLVKSVKNTGATIIMQLMHERRSIRSSRSRWLIRSSLSLANSLNASVSTLSFMNVCKDPSQIRVCLYLQ